MHGDVKHIFEELREHLPYSIFSVTAGMAILGLFTFAANMLGQTDISSPARDLFHIFHPIHVLLSAAATTTMFWRHEKIFIKALLIGSVGSVFICGISDIFIPYFAGLLLGVNMDLHICVFSHTGFLLPFVLTGIFAGFIISDKSSKSTFFSHAAHVLVSSMASILYLIGFGLSEWIHVAGLVLIYMILAVIIPCCSSDIIFPLLLAKKRK